MRARAKSGLTRKLPEDVFGLRTAAQAGQVGIAYHLDAPVGEWRGSIDWQRFVIKQNPLGAITEIPSLADVEAEIRIAVFPRSASPIFMLAVKVRLLVVPLAVAEKLDAWAASTVAPYAIMSNSGKAISHVCGFK